MIFYINGNMGCDVLKLWKTELLPPHGIPDEECAVHGGETRIRFCGCMSGSCE